MEKVAGERGIHLWTLIDWSLPIFVINVRALLVDTENLAQLTHNLTVVFFSRTYIRRLDGEKGGKPPPSVHIDSDGRWFEDHYKTVIFNETNTDWDSLVYQIKKEFVKYPKMVKVCAVGTILSLLVHVCIQSNLFSS